MLLYSKGPNVATKSAKNMAFCFSFFEKKHSENKGLSIDNLNWCSKLMFDKSMLHKCISYNRLRTFSSHKSASISSPIQQFLIKSHFIRRAFLSVLKTVR